MMLVVSDASPIIALVNIDSIQVLASLYGQVVIPPAVAEELGRASRPEPARRFIAAPPSWLLVRSPEDVEDIPKLHPGEKEAISLARELKADLLLVDDRDAFHAAVERGLNATGTVGVLRHAARRGLLDLRRAFDDLKRTDFWISHTLLNNELRSFEDEQHSTS